MINRDLASRIQRFAEQYPVVTITGPRQSGKTTLARFLFPDKRYFSLEDLDVRERARNDPRAFLADCVERGAILDEIQRVPGLLSYIQTLADERGRSGDFILTGSQNFALMESVSQTLAGRTALATLLPLTLAEAYAGQVPANLDEVLFTGFYPRIHDRHLPPGEALSFYVQTYLERDVRALVQVRDLSKFELFLKLCAGRTGQVLNLSALGNECGVNHNTARSWLSVLEASYVVHLLRPHHRNFNKRIIKAPKLYFVDVGLAAHLLEIADPVQLKAHPLRGALFETLVVGEALKARMNSGALGGLGYFRDNVGNEVDLVVESGGRALPVEIKSGQTVADDAFRGIRYFLRLQGREDGRGLVVYGGRESWSGTVADVVGFADAAARLR